MPHTAGCNAAVNTLQTMWSSVTTGNTLTGSNTDARVSEWAALGQAPAYVVA
jgi:hypothetical protein